MKLFPREKTVGIFSDMKEVSVVVLSTGFWLMKSRISCERLMKSQFGDSLVVAGAIRPAEVMLNSRSCQKLNVVKRNSLLRI